MQYMLQQLCRSWRTRLCKSARMTWQSLLYPLLFPHRSTALLRALSSTAYVILQQSRHSLAFVVHVVLSCRMICQFYRWCWVSCKLHIAFMHICRIPYMQCTT
jgi:hypothetical protein